MAAEAAAEEAEAEAGDKAPPADVKVVKFVEDGTGNSIVE